MGLWTFFNLHVYQNIPLFFNFSSLVVGRKDEILSSQEQQLMDATEVERISPATRPEYLGSRISAKCSSSELETMRSCARAVEIQTFQGYPRPETRILAINLTPLQLLQQQQQQSLPRRRWFPVSCNLVHCNSCLHVFLCSYLMMSNSCNWNRLFCCWNLAVMEVMSSMGHQCFLDRWYKNPLGSWCKY